MCWFCTVTVTYLVIHISAWTFDALQASRPQTELPHSVLIVCQRGGGGGQPSLSLEQVNRPAVLPM